MCKPVGRRHPSSRSKPANERSFAHCGLPGELRIRYGLVQAPLQALQQRTQRAPFTPINRSRNVLGLAALALRGNDQSAGDLIGDRCAKIAAHQI